jgi:cyclic-di-GMP-binding protein
VTLQQGIDQDTAKRITKLIKDSKLKVQASIQGDQVRVSGKSRDDLQTVIQVLRDADLDVPLQFTNYR